MNTQVQRSIAIGMLDPENPFDNEEEDDASPITCPDCDSTDVQEIIGVNPHNYGETYFCCRDCDNEWR